MGNSLDRLNNTYKERSKLIKIAFSITRNLDDAEEVIQEVFTRLLKNFGGIPDSIPDCNVRSYIGKMTNGIACDRARRRVIETRYFSDDLMDERESDVEDPLNKVEIREILGSIREPSATFLRMKALEGKSYKEIAEEKGICYSTLITRIQYERERIRRLYNEN